MFWGPPGLTLSLVSLKDYQQRNCGSPLWLVHYQRGTSLIWGCLPRSPKAQTSYRRSRWVRVRTLSWLLDHPSRVSRALHCSKSINKARREETRCLGPKNLVPDVGLWGPELRSFGSVMFLKIMLRLTRSNASRKVRKKTWYNFFYQWSIFISTVVGRMQKRLFFPCFCPGVGLEVTVCTQTAEVSSYSHRTSSTIDMTLNDVES